ncbi:hypothetical protein OIU76_023080, partial [Salix suchowensis]
MNFCLSFRRNSTKGLQANDSTGRLLKYDVRTNQVTVLKRNLSGAAGAAVSGDGRFVLVSEFVAAATVTQGSQTPVPIRVRVDGSGTISETVSLEAQYGSTPISEAQQSGLS